MKNIIIILTAIILLHSCKKATTTYKITGKMIGCINGIETPYLTNKSIDLFQQNNGSNNNSKVLANATVDSAGNFSLTYTTNNKLDELIIRESSGFGFNNIIIGIPIQDISNLKVYYSARYNLVVNINAINPYTNLDTLYVIKPDSLNTLKITGPFTNRRLFKLLSYPVSPRMIYGSNGANQAASLNNTIDLSKGYVIDNSKLYGDTVYVNIDVR